MCKDLILWGVPPVGWRVDVPINLTSGTRAHVRREQECHESNARITGDPWRELYVRKCRCTR